VFIPEAVGMWPLHSKWYLYVASKHEEISAHKMSTLVPFSNALFKSNTFMIATLRIIPSQNFHREVRTRMVLWSNSPRTCCGLADLEILDDMAVRQPRSSIRCYNVFAQNVKILQFCLLQFSVHVRSRRSYCFQMLARKRIVFGQRSFRTQP
jgi:hypothetical protein